jgi:hypothetical protein
MTGDVLSTMTLFLLRRTGVLKCTNRAYASWQIPEGVNGINHDIAYHRQVGKSLQEANKLRVNDVTGCADMPAPPQTSPFSGVVILYKKSAWKKVQFRSMEKGRLTGIDNLLHIDLRDNGLKVGLMTGIYVYHWHRADGVNVADTPAPDNIPEPKQVKYLPEGFEWARDYRMPHTKRPGDRFMYLPVDRTQEAAQEYDGILRTFPFRISRQEHYNLEDTGEPAGSNACFLYR